MAKRLSSELRDEPEDPQETEAERDEEASWEPPRVRRMAVTRSDIDWDDEEDSDWLDDGVEDLEGEAPQGCDEGEVYRLLGRPGRRGRDD
jgi:hypothetical protein